MPVKSGSDYFQFLFNRYSLVDNLTKFTKSLCIVISVEQVDGDCAECPICKQTFKGPRNQRKNNFKAHWQNVHLKIKKIKCKVCGRTFGRNHHLISHYTTHRPKRLKVIG